jgi:hypothetical protein
VLQGVWWWELGLNENDEEGSASSWLIMGDAYAGDAYQEGVGSELD